MAAASACASAPLKVTGTASYRERIAMPPEAVFEATLQDVSRADAAAEVIGRATLSPAGQPPYRFEIEVDPARIDEARSYSVRATITIDGRLVFTSDVVTPVLTRGHGSEVELPMRHVAGRADAGAQPASLERTTWMLVEIDGAPPPAEAKERPVQLQLDAGTRRASGFAGVNQVAGGFEHDGERLRFSHMATTLRAGPPELMQLEAAVLRALDATRSQRISSDGLVLCDESGRSLARFVVAP